MIWQNWTNVILGIGVVAVAFSGFTDATLMWTLIILGTVIVLVELWEGSAIAMLDESKNK
jgi:hypothetical protein